MNKIFSAALIATLASGPVLAQPVNGQYSGSGVTQPAPNTTHTGVKPVDHGPFTAEASRAYQGGGVVLQGAPGAPPPLPQPTPPGQTPRNMVPQ